MPGFHHSVAVLPLPFFRSTAAVAGENVYIGSVQNADWLFTYGRTEKIGFDPIATERRLWRNGR